MSLPLYRQKELNFINVKMLNSSKIEGLRYLAELGLTRTQSNLYLSLMLHGDADARLLAFWTSLPRTEVYRSLSELQEKGLVDKIVDSPLKLSVVPPSIGLQTVIDRKFNDAQRMQTTLKKFTREFEGKQKYEKENNYKITLIGGRERIIAHIKQQHDNAKSSVDVISFLPRWLQIANECLDSYKRSSERGVKFRIIVRLPNDQQGIFANILEAHSNKNTLVKTIVGPQRVNTAIYDREQTSFSYYPDKSISGSPMILTNHPCLVELSLNSFEQIWNSPQCVRLVNDALQKREQDTV
jgi:sugar-specific transcriptional regulator TrmB